MTTLRPLGCLCFAGYMLLARQAPADVVTTYPYVGITHITRTETSPRNLTMHIVVIELRAPGLRFKLTPPGGTRDTVRQTTLDFLTQEQAQVAIDAHFFLPFPSDDTDANVVGLAASEGVVYSPFEPQPIAEGYVDQSYAIMPYAPALNIDPCNRASIVHRDPAYEDNKHVLEQVILWNAVSGSAQIVRNGVKSIPTYSGPPDGLNPINGYSDLFSWYSEPRARTCIGLTRYRERLVLFTVDEAGMSAGMTGDEVADLLINDYGAYNALNLDGGGSTSMALQDPITHIGQLVNVPSESTDGRATGSNLAVFAAPNPQAALALTLTPTNLVIVSWPASAWGLHLQCAAGLGTTNWENVSTPPHRVGDRMQVGVASQSSCQFFRLTRQPPPPLD